MSASRAADYGKTDQIPAELALAEEMGVVPMTVCRAMQERVVPMRRIAGRVVCAATIVLTLLAHASLASAQTDEWKVKRKEVFEFAEKPALVREGDKTTITFAAKDFCDVTVAVEDDKGKIVRFLACGVLGRNAPEPFAKDSLKQSLVWDGKNNKGEYVKDPNRHVVRVSLGLQARYERRLYWSPYKKSSYGSAIIHPRPEGVYVFEGGFAHERVTLLDHKGDYVRTVYPFPANKLADVKGLMWQEMMPTGERLVRRNGLNQSTLLSTSDLAYNEKWPTAGGNVARALAVRDSLLLLADARLNRLATDGTTGGRPINGPSTSVPVFVPPIHAWKGGVVNVPPSDMAISPDGKWLYLTGYAVRRSWLSGWLCGVARVAIDGDARIENFAGSLGEINGNGKVEAPFLADLKGNPLAPGQIGLAASIDVDAVGRVYVADWAGNCIQVFDPAGKHLKDLAVKQPAVVRVHPKTGDVFVVSWYLNERVNEKPKDTSKPTLSRLGRFEDDGKLLASYPLAIPRFGVWDEGPVTRVGIDFYADPVTLWVEYPGQDESYTNLNWPKSGIRMFALRDGQLELIRHFAEDSFRQTMRYSEPRLARMRIYFNPGNGRLYAGEPPVPCVAYQKKEFAQAALINPDTGKVERMEPLPFSCEDMAFDADGLAYLRTKDFIVRYDSGTWREVPFDYGLERNGIAHTDVKLGSAVSGIDLPSVQCASYWHHGGMYVSAKGHIAVTCYNSTPVATDRSAEKFLDTQSKKYSPKVFPGRNPDWCVHVFDRYGKILYEDAVPGSTQLSGVGLDCNDNVYAMTLGQRIYDGKPYPNVVSATVFKAKPKVTKVLSMSRSVPVPIPEGDRPKRQPDIHGGPYGTAWFENASWLYGGVGVASKFLPFAGGGCWCEHSQMVLDDFARTFVPETDTFHVAVLDSSGNLIMRIGQYGNVDDGVPLIKEGGSPNPRSIGGDEVPLFLPRFCAADTDRRLFVSDAGQGNAILAVKLGYHAEEKITVGTTR